MLITSDLLCKINNNFLTKVLATNIFYGKFLVLFLIKRLIISNFVSSLYSTIQTEITPKHKVCLLKVREQSISGVLNIEFFSAISFVLP